MKIIEIAPLSNGAHRNQSYPGFVPDGWAVVPDGLETENFPFGEVVVEDKNGVPAVTGWTPGVVPEPEPMPEPEPTAEERIAELEEALEMILSGVTE